MKIIKRNGNTEEVSFDKVIWRLKVLCNMEPKLKNIDCIAVAQKVCSQIYSGIETYKLDELASEICISNITKHYEFGNLASRLVISNNHKLTLSSFSDTISILHNNVDKHGYKCSLISDNIYNIIINNKNKLDSIIDYGRDFLYDYFGYKTLEKAYLLKVNGIIVERIQDLFMRVSLGIHGDNIEKVIETYNFMSQKKFIHATPTLFHSGTNHSQMLSCFLLGIDDSVSSIYKTLGDCAQISKWAGGIGLWCHNIRSSNSIIRSTNGKSGGIVPMLRVFNETARHINQSGKRNGSFAMYLEPWHADIIDFLEAKRNHGDENARARDLFYALWICDLFMERVNNNQKWSLMCPDKCQNLTSLYGEEFNSLYTKYEMMDGYVTKVINARELWEIILVSQIETGTPYMCYKDAANRKSNQKNIGTIRSSNLCTEIMEYSDSDQYACCTLASIGLPSYVNDYDYNKISKLIVFGKDNCKYCNYSKKYLDNKIKYEYFDIQVDIHEDNKEYLNSLNINNIEIKTFPQIFVEYNDNSIEYIGGFNELVTFFKPTYNFKELYEATKIVTYNLNRIIDLNYYPIPETRYSNRLHRPLGIGVQGLADVYAKMRIAFDSPEAHLLNTQIFAIIYYASMEKSMEIAKERNIGMNRIRELRELYCKDYIYNTKKAKSNLLENDVYKWDTGEGYTKCENEELQQLEKKYLPIDEELYVLDKNGQFIENKDSRFLGSYSSFIDSPISKGQFQFDLWDKEPIRQIYDIILDWDNLREQIICHGVRNSLLLAPMPTASTSQIMGNNECIEPFTSNIYSRNTLAGTFIVINKYLLNDLVDIGLWDNDIKNKIISNGGSIKDIDIIPSVFQNLYKIAWDLSQKTLIDQAVERGIYVCQSQSLNLFLKNPNFSNLSSMHNYAWSKGLKTGLYYLRTRAVAKAQQFTIEPEKKIDCESCSG